jgi:hypothetical protein
MDKEKIDLLKRIQPNKAKFFLYSNRSKGYADWTFTQLVEYMGYKQAAKIALDYAKNRVYAWQYNSRLAITYKKIHAKGYIIEYQCNGTEACLKLNNEGYIFPDKKLFFREWEDMQPESYQQTKAIPWI